MARKRRGKTDDREADGGDEGGEDSTAAQAPEIIGQTPGGEPIHEHPLAASLHSDAQKHEHLVTLTGYVGRSSITGNIRLYLHHDFQSYYEIAQTDIRHSWPEVTEDTTEPTNVSIVRTAKPKLVVHQTVSSGAASLLKGPMASSLLAGAIKSAVTTEVWEPTQPPPPPPHGRLGGLTYTGGDGPVE
jgi:hypothetical protein